MSRSFYDPLLQELYEAGLQLRPYLEASTDTEPELEREEAWKAAKEKLAFYDLPYAERLRREAAEVEAKDAAIIRFRAALDAVGGQQS